MVDFVKAVRALINRPMPWAADRPETVVEAPTVLARISTAILKPLERWAPRLIETTASDYVRDKSECELLFLVCVSLSVFLVAVVLPLCDALLDESEEDQPRRLKTRKNAMLKTREAGADVAKINAQVATLSFSGGCSALTRDRRRPGSILRSTVTFLERIDEESDEDYYETGEEDEDDSSDSSVQSIETPTSSPPATPEKARTRATDDAENTNPTSSPPRQDKRRKTIQATAASSPSRLPRRVPLRRRNKSDRR